MLNSKLLQDWNDNDLQVVNIALSLLDTDSLTGNKRRCNRTTVAGHMPGLIKLNVHVGFNYHLCGLVVRVFGYRSGGPGFDSRRFQIF
jgi:hypothetical protein